MVLITRVAPSLYRTVRLDLHSTKRRHLRLCQRQSSGQERTKPAASRERAERTAQLLGNMQHSGNIFLGRISPGGFVGKQPLGKLLNFRTGAVLSQSRPALPKTPNSDEAS